MITRVLVRVSAMVLIVAVWTPGSTGRSTRAS